MGIGRGEIAMAEIQYILCPRMRHGRTQLPEAGARDEQTLEAVGASTQLDQGAACKPIHTRSRAEGNPISIATTHYVFSNPLHCSRSSMRLDCTTCHTN